MITIFTFRYLQFKSKNWWHSRGDRFKYTWQSTFYQHPSFGFEDFFWNWPQKCNFWQLSFDLKMDQNYPNDPMKVFSNVHFCTFRLWCYPDHNLVHFLSNSRPLWLVNVHIAPKTVHIWPTIFVGSFRVKFGRDVG